ncbi:MAG: hypothetical protein AAF772_13925, partial [Acidobacteriota bacterium]
MCSFAILRGDLGDDRVFLLQTRLERLDALRQLLLATIGLAVLRLQSSGGVIKQLALPLVEQARLEAVLLGQRRDRHFVRQVTPQDRGFLIGAEATTATTGLAHIRIRHALNLGASG